MTEQAQQDLLTIYHAALAAVHGETCTRDALRASMPSGPVAVIAIGKAAAAMARGAVSALGEQLEAGLLITKTEHGDADLQADRRFRCLESAHPEPDARSLQAGEALLSFIAEQPMERRLLFLISGGTSALVEVLPEGVTLDDLQRVNRWLLGSGLDITAINQVRKALSAIKGGGLLRWLRGRELICRAISDVPGDLPQVIGSGLLFPSPRNELPNLPAWIQTLLSRLPKLVAPETVAVDMQLVATLAQAKQAAARKARELGYEVVLHPPALAGDAHDTGQALARQLCAAPPALHIWGGETTVRLPEHPGRGGRNQHLALAAATVLAGQDDCWLLAAGTDGSDGPTTAAGALVDGATQGRGEAAGINADNALAAADAGSFLRASGDLIHTGPTGTNVMDLVLGLRVAPV
jgi:hydroxypyruvate reductase